MEIKGAISTSPDNLVYSIDPLSYERLDYGADIGRIARESKIQTYQALIAKVVAKEPSFPNSRYSIQKYEIHNNELVVYLSMAHTSSERSSDEQGKKTTVSKVYGENLEYYLEKAKISIPLNDFTVKFNKDGNLDGLLVVATNKRRKTYSDAIDFLHAYSLEVLSKQLVATKE